MSGLDTFLAGTRVLDFSRHLPGPLATLMLVDMGAEVIKIEPPAGDEMRQIGPRGKAGWSIYYDSVNAGKTVCAADLNDAVQRSRVLDLAREADVLVESFRPGVMERLGLGYETLRGVNPGLVYCAISGFGRDGPLVRQAGHDANYLSLAGMLHHNGTDAPMFFDPPVADCTASLMAVIAMLGALNRRRAGGRGCLLDLSLADAPMPLQTFQLAALGATGHVPRRGGELLNGGAAYYRIYPTADGRHVSLCAIEPKFWQGFCRAAGRPEWLPRQADPLPQRALTAEITALFANLTLAEAVARFETADCCFAPVLDLEQAVQSSHHQSRGFVRQTPTGELQALLPAKVDGQPPSPRPTLKEADLEAIRWR